jgi:hypothetical protein
MRLRALLAAAVLAAPAAAQSGRNDVPLNNGADVAFTYSDPSVGASVGTVPPAIDGDLYWKVLPGDRILQHQTELGAFVEIDGYLEMLWDTQWTTPPDFYDRSHGSALAGGNGTLEPAFFQLGWTSETLVSLGSSGFGNPCTLFPSLCSPPGSSCLPPGRINGYIVDLKIEGTPGSGIVVPADGTAASDHAVTWFVTGGMTALGGPCGLGDYTIQDLHSYDETIAGLPDGTSPYGGFQIAGSGPLPEAATHTTESNLAFRHAMLNVVADSGGGLGLEASDNGGGGMNALRLPVGTGAAALGVEIRSRQAVGTANLAAVAASYGKLPAPGIELFGAHILIAPLPVSSFTASVWNGAVVEVIFQTTSEGVLAGAPIPVPASGVGFDLYLQGLVLDLATGSAVNTNLWRTSFTP